MEGDDGVHRSICCRRLLSADSRRSNGKAGIVDIGPGPGGVSPFAAWRNPVTT